MKHGEIVTSPWRMVEIGDFTNTKSPSSIHLMAIDQRNDGDIKPAMKYEDVVGRNGISTMIFFVVFQNL